MDIELKPLNEQVVVITGASSGIGLATAEAAAEAGAKLVLAARMDREPKLPTPMIAPEKVAAAILEAATDPTLERKVGAMAKLNATMAKLMPSLAKKLEAAQTERQQLDEPPRDPEGTLRKPGGGGGKRGEGPVESPPSHRWRTEEDVMAETTIDHETIRQWVEARGGCPARVKRTGGAEDPGLLRIDFPGYSGKQTLERLEWDEFFDKFDASELALIYQDRTRGGQPSRFSKLVKRASVGLSSDAGGAQRSRSGAQTEEEDAISLLTSQHRMVEQMIEQLTQVSPRSVEFRQIFEQLADALAIHATIEERIFYPAVKSGATEELLEESVDDHLAVKRVLATMLETAPDGDILAELEELGGLNEEHVIEEEHELFPQVRRQLDKAALRELGARMNELAAELRREGAPRLHVPDETEAPAPI